MKKIAVILLSVMMVFVVASSSLANSSIYLDYNMVDGKQDDSLFSLNSGNYIALGGTYQFDNNWSASGEYTNNLGVSLFGLIEDKVSTYKIKCGYAVINNKDLRIDLTAGYYSNSQKYSINVPGFNGDIVKTDIESYLVGADALFNITNNITVSAVFEYGLSGKYKITPNSDLVGQVPESMPIPVKGDLDSLLNYKVGFNYYFTEKLGFSLGYRSSSCKVDAGKTTTSGFITGVTYKF